MAKTTNAFTDERTKVEIESGLGEFGYYQCRVRVWVGTDVDRAPEVGKRWLEEVIGYPALGAMCQSSFFDLKRGCWVVSAGL